MQYIYQVWAENFALIDSWLKCDLILHDNLVEAIMVLKKRKIREEDQVD